MKKLVLAIVLAPTAAFAHPGHGATDPSSVRHYLVEPSHVVVIAAALVAVAFAIGMWGWQKSRTGSGRSTASRDRAER